MQPCEQKRAYRPKGEEKNGRKTIIGFTLMEHFVDNGLFATAFVFAQDALELIVVDNGKSIYLHLFILESEILTDLFQLFSL